jgi:hypothetical protein
MLGGFGYLVSFGCHLLGLSVHAYAKAEGRPDNRVLRIDTIA